MRKGLNRPGKIVTGKLRKVFALFGRAAKSVSRKYGNMPRPLRIISVYLLVLLVTGGIFAWRVVGLRSTRPDPTPWSFDFLEVPYDWEQFLHSGSTADANDGDTEAAAGLPGEDEDITDAISEEPPAGPVFQPGIWPVDGELLYAYDSVIVIRDNPTATILRLSKGIAIVASAGTEVASVWDGTVHNISEKDMPYGKSITIKHDFELVTYFGALGSVKVKEGDIVKQGEIIGTVAVGDDQEPSHLFLSIMEDGKYIDPEDKLLPR